MNVPGPRRVVAVITVISSEPSRIAVAAVDVSCDGARRVSVSAVSSVVSCRVSVTVLAVNTPPPATTPPPSVSSPGVSVAGRNSGAVARNPVESESIV